MLSRKKRGQDYQRPDNRPEPLKFWQPATDIKTRKQRVKRMAARGGVIRAVSLVQELNHLREKVVGRYLRPGDKGGEDEVRQVAYHCRD